MARPHVIVNRIAKRLTRDNWILQIPQPRDTPFLYMPNPAMIHPRSSKLEHFLGLVDLFIELGQPEVYQIEPQISDAYQPDVYLHHGPDPVIVEYQRTRITNKRMQEKIDAFAYANRHKQHNARILWIVAEHTYDVKVPLNFTVVHRKPSA